MSIIRTVTGDIRPETLGVTYTHEHLLSQLPSPYHEADPDTSFDNMEAALRELGFFKAAGGHALVEMSTVELSRSPHGLEKLSKQSGITVIAATGHNKDQYSAGHVGWQSVEMIAQRMIREITQGMDTTTIRAGVIKAATSKDHATESERHVIQAAGIAHRETGAPVSTHTEAGTYALEQIRMLRQAGVPSERILIGHLDRNLDWEYQREIARSGVYMGFDQIGKEHYAPDSERIAIMKRLIEAGYAEQLVLAGDMARKSYWPSYGFGNGPGLTHILWRFVPLMLRNGISHEVIDTMLVRNPARLLSF